GQAAIELTTDFPTFLAPNGKPPTFRNIRIAGITCAKAKTAVRMVGLADNVLRGITLENVKVSCDEGLHCAAAHGLHLKNVNITPRVGPVLSLKDSQEVLIDGLHHDGGTSVFLDLRGRQTRNIRLCTGSGGGNGHAGAKGLRPS